MKQWIYLFILFLMISCRKQGSFVPSSVHQIYIPNSLTKNSLDSMRLWVTGIKDGDSFIGIDKERNEHEVRMIFIDAPEKFQDYSVIAKNFSADLLFQDSVTIYFENKDVYGRYLALVVNSEGKVVNEELLKNGLAWHYSQYSDDAQYQFWEDSARHLQIGIFSKDHAVAPWTWRKARSQ